jgi:hypothetical protein
MFVRLVVIAPGEIHRSMLVRTSEDHGAACANVVVGNRLREFN